MHSQPAVWFWTNFLTFSKGARISSYINKEKKEVEDDVLGLGVMTWNWVGGEEMAMMVHKSPQEFLGVGEGR